MVPLDLITLTYFSRIRLLQPFSFELCVHAGVSVLFYPVLIRGFLETKTQGPTEK
jgi:hypothetical protein